MIPFNEQLIIEVYTSSKDALGSPVETWTVLGTYRCAIKQSGGAKSYDNDLQQLSHSFNTVFYTRFISDLTYKCRIRYNDEVYVIKSINTVMRRKGHEIIAERDQNNGM